MAPMHVPSVRLAGAQCSVCRKGYLHSTMSCQRSGPGDTSKSIFAVASASVCTSKLSILDLSAIERWCDIGEALPSLISATQART